MRSGIVTRWLSTILVVLALLLSTLAASALAAPLSPVTIRRVQGVGGYRGVVDTYLHEWFPDNKYNARGRMVIRGDGAARPILSFDLDGIVPPGATVTGARLRLHIVSGSAVTMRASLYQVVRPWTQKWANWRISGYARGWTTPGCSEPGVDRSAVPADTIALRGVGRTVSFDIMKLVRAWIAHPDENFGLLLVGHDAHSGGQFDLASSEFPDPSKRPALVITYVTYWHDLGPDPDLPVGEGWDLISTTHGNISGSDLIRYADFMLRDAALGEPVLVARVDVSQGAMYVQDAATGVWMPADGHPLGEPGILKTPMAWLDAGASAILTEPASVQVLWAIKLTRRAGGRLYHLYLRQGSDAGQVSAWEARSELARNHPPELVTPSLSRQVVSTGAKLWFDPRYRDRDGRDNLADIYLAITDRFPTSPDAQGLVLRYDAQAGRMYLRGDDGAWLPEGGVIPRTSFRLENSYGIVYGPGSRVINCDALTLGARWVVEFKPGMVGRYWLYMRAVDALGDAYGGDTRWKWKGWIEIVP